MHPKRRRCRTPIATVLCLVIIFAIILHLTSAFTLTPDTHVFVPQWTWILNLVSRNMGSWLQWHLLRSLPSHPWVQVWHRTTIIERYWPLHRQSHRVWPPWGPRYPRLMNKLSYGPRDWPVPFPLHATPRTGSAESSLWGPLLVAATRLLPTKTYSPTNGRRKTRTRVIHLKFRSYGVPWK
jgi:hypothetical protein